MSVTMRDVAQRAGVSKATVSYVLNGRETSMRITDETRTRILDAVRELGYHPNALARGLTRKEAGAIAIVMQYPSVFSGWSGFINELMHGVTDAAIRLGYDVMLHTRQATTIEPLLENGDATLNEVAILTDGRVDGALLLRDTDDPLGQALEKAGFPSILIFSHSNNPLLWYVDCDNRQGGEMATQHLISLGHTKIVHLCGPHVSGPARERKIGFLCAMDKANLEVPHRYIVEIPSPLSDYKEALELFTLPEGDRPTAVFAWSDDVAILMMSLLKREGLKVPDDVAVIGFDSTALCDHTDPPLTSVRQPIYDMADTAFTLLVSRLSCNTLAPTQLRVSPELTVRDSCGGTNIRKETR